MSEDVTQWQHFLSVVATLRDPENGCKWDCAQTFETLSSLTIEEAYELQDAVLQKESLAVCDELGDLLFHILLYADIAKKSQLFDFELICKYAADKLIRRHPTVFSLQKESISWEIQKQQEREQKSLPSILDDVPQALPAMFRAEKIQKRVASFGFDWQQKTHLFEKVKEELAELEAALLHEQENKIEEELGDLFFVLVNFARHCKLSPENTLQRANQKFERRFRQVEARVLKQGKKLQEATLDELELHWQIVKQQE